MKAAIHGPLKSSLPPCLSQPFCKIHSGLAPSPETEVSGESVAAPGAAAAPGFSIGASQLPMEHSHKLGPAPLQEPRPIPALLSSSCCAFGETSMVTKACLCTFLQYFRTSTNHSRYVHVLGHTQNRHNIHDSSAYLYLGTFVPPNPKCLSRPRHS